MRISRRCIRTDHCRHSSSHWFLNPCLNSCQSCPKPCLSPLPKPRAAAIRALIGALSHTHTHTRARALSLCRQGSLSKHDERPKEEKHKPRILLLRNSSSLLSRLPRLPPRRRLLILGPITHQDNGIVGTAVQCQLLHYCTSVQLLALAADATLKVGSTLPTLAGNEEVRVFWAMPSSCAMPSSWVMTSRPGVMMLRCRAHKIIQK
jgi:hypothetical protein